MNMHLIEYAIRYCTTRDSYAFEDGLETAEAHWNELSVATQLDVLVAVHAKGFTRGRFPRIASAYAVRYPSRTENVDTHNSKELDQ